MRVRRCAPRFGWWARGEAVEGFRDTAPESSWSLGGGSTRGSAIGMQTRGRIRDPSSALCARGIGGARGGKAGLTASSGLRMFATVRLGLSWHMWRRGLLQEW
jgi:hypothetical protein